jgi:hypothetical protein
MLKKISSVGAKLVTLESPLHISEILNRLDEELNKPKDGQLFSIEGLGSRKEIEARVQSLLGESNFMYINFIFSLNSLISKHFYSGCFPQYHMAVG